MKENSFFESFIIRKCECWKPVLNFLYLFHLVLLAKRNLGMNISKISFFGNEESLKKSVGSTGLTDPDFVVWQVFVFAREVIHNLIIYPINQSTPILETQTALGPVTQYMCLSLNENQQHTWFPRQQVIVCVSFKLCRIYCALLAE